MKSLCSCAALAVATALAHGSFANAIAQGKTALQSFRDDSTTPTGLTPPDAENHCTVEINKWRKELNEDAPNYEKLADGDPSADLAAFFRSYNCGTLKSGNFKHIVGEGDPTAFVISATRPPDSMRAAAAMTCEEALKEWKKGFEEFSGNYPEAFTDNTGVYAKPNAVGLVSLLSKKTEKIYCGAPTSCDEGTLVCYFKPAGVKAGERPVTPEMWHKVEENFTLKPKVEAHSDDQQECLDAVNAVREVAGLDLPPFTAPQDPKKMKTSSAATYEDALYNLTCEDIKNSAIDPTVADKCTLIYAVKAGGTAPTAAEAIEFWKTGFNKLGTEVPPAFTKKALERAEAVDGKIYYDNAVAGFASLMVDDPREMKCYNATGCANAALLCFLSTPTLVEKTKPISDGTWKKILDLKEANSGTTDKETIKFTEREEAENCLAEINEFRTQESLGLKPFVARDKTSVDSLKPVDSEALAKGLTCEALKAGNAPIMSDTADASVMYYSGTSATCFEALNAWKEGYKKFSNVTIPPKYTSTEELYKTGAATNLISLVSEGTDTKTTCYTVSGCTEQGLVCVLQPAAFKKEESPITEVTWAKVTKTLSNGVTAGSVCGTLLSSVLVAVGLFALNY